MRKDFELVVVTLTIERLYGILHNIQIHLGVSRRGTNLGEGCPIIIWPNFFKYCTKNDEN